MPERRGRVRRRFARAARPALPARLPSGLGATAKRLQHNFRGHRTTAVCAIVLFFASSAIDPLVPAFFKWLIDNGFKSDLPASIWWVPVVIVTLFFVCGLLGFGEAYLFARFTADMVFKLRTDLVRALMNADASFYTELSHGVATARVINDPQNAINALAGAATTVLRDGTTFIALVAYLFYLNWQLALVSLVTVPLLAIVVKSVQARVYRISGETHQSQNRLIGIVDDIARAWRVVRTFDAGDFERRRFADEALRLRRKTLKSATAGATMTPLTQVVASAGVAIIVTLALFHAHRGEATVGDFVAFVTMLLMTISPMRHITDVTQPIVGGLVQAQACFALMDFQPEPDRGHRELTDAKGEVRFEQLAVRYPGTESAAVEGIDIAMPAGHTIALVGPSGAGKSTLLNVMLAFVEPSAGRVLFDGIDIREVRKASLRRQFAVVSQDIVLFDGTIAANVVYAQAPDPARVEACLNAADLGDFVRGLPEGADTCIGTNGATLSGGQHQRLAIALQGGERLGLRRGHVVPRLGLRAADPCGDRTLARPAHAGAGRPPAQHGSPCRQDLRALRRTGRRIRQPRRADGPRRALCRDGQNPSLRLTAPLPPDPGARHEHRAVDRVSEPARAGAGGHVRAPERPRLERSADGVRALRARRFSLHRHLLQRPVGRRLEAPVRSSDVVPAPEGHGAVRVDDRLSQAGAGTGLDRGAPGQPFRPRRDLRRDAGMAGRAGRMLFFRLRALEAAVLRGAAFETADAIRNPVRLGLVITHFNRPTQALPAIERLQRVLLDHPEWGARLSLTVVDNSSNLGGTGGFVRGLLSLIDGGEHTHALFMDDDASCEPASVARTLALLAHCRDPRLSVAGALLREGAPWELAEKGACFDGQVRQLHAGLDMRRVGDLLTAEKELRRPAQLLPLQQRTRRDAGDAAHPGRAGVFPRQPRHARCARRNRQLEADREAGAARPARAAPALAAAPPRGGALAAAPPPRAVAAEPATAQVSTLP